MNIKPRSDIVIIKHSGAYKGPIILPPGVTRMKVDIGEVIAAGPKCTSVQPGNRVFYGQDLHETCRFAGEQYLVAHETDLVGVAEETNG